ncbi:Odorant receptor 72 [Blattella germanica]|nr:Odorant receptor 72 [Blattella germanica]
MFSNKNEDESRFPDDFLRVNIKTLWMCGLWNCFGIQRKENFTYTLFSIMASFVLLHQSVTQTAYLMFNMKYFAILISSAGLILTYLTLLFKRFVYLTVEQRIYRLVNGLRDGDLSSSSNWTEEQVEMAKDYDRRARNMSWSYYWLGVVCLFFLSMSGIVNGPLKEDKSVNSTSWRNLPYNEAIFEFDIQNVVYYGIALVLQYLAVFFGPTTNIGIDTMFVALVIHASGQIQILKLSLTKMKERAIRMEPDDLNIRNTDRPIWDKIDPDSITEELKLIESFNDQFDEDNLESTQYENDEGRNYLSNLLQVKLSMCLNDCIRHHQEIAKFTTELEYIFSPMSLIQFLSSSVTLCLIIFSIAVSDVSRLPTNIVFLSISITQLLLYCWFGSELTYQFESLVAAIYDAPWYGSSLNFQKNILTMLIRATKSFILTGGTIYLMNLNTFLTMMKASFSYYTMLKEMDIS